MSKKCKFALRKHDMTIHVYPLNDWIDHDAESGECLCEPQTEWLDENGLPMLEPVIVHNAIDQREKQESANLH